MIRKLLVVALSALVAGLACLGIAFAIAGPEIVRNGGYTIDFDDETQTGPHVRKVVAFDPAVALVLNAPVDLEFTRGDRTEMTISGNAELMKAMLRENFSTPRKCIQSQGAVTWPATKTRGSKR